MQTRLPFLLESSCASREPAGALRVGRGWERNAHEAGLPQEAEAGTACQPGGLEAAECPPEGLDVL